MAKIMETIPATKGGKLHSAFALGPFDKAKEVLEKEGYRVSSLEDQAGLRIEHVSYPDFSGKRNANTAFSALDNWVREGLVYVPNKGIFLTKNSPIMENARQATKCNKKGREFYLTNEQVENSLANAVEITKTEIPTNRFAEEEITAFAFGKNAKDYGELFVENNIGSIKIVNLCAPEEKPFARQAYFHEFNRLDKAGFGGWTPNPNLHNKLGFVCGVREKESPSKKRSIVNLILCRFRR